MLELKDDFVLYPGYIALQLIERKKCLSKLNVKWQGMISLQERLRMMQQTLPLLLILLGLSGQAKVAFNVIKISLVKIGCRK